MQFIAANTRLAPVRVVPEISLYGAHAASGLWRLAGADDAPPPYWAYPWAGGLVLARHLLDSPASVAGRRVLDLGTGSGLVAIAAAIAGASTIVAADIDPNAVAAARLNAAANHVAICVAGDDLTAGEAPNVDLVLAGDVFYDDGVGRRMLGFFDKCLAARIVVLIGDPGRLYLPRPRLRPIAAYPVGDFGEAGTAALKTSTVFELMAAEEAIA